MATKLNLDVKTYLDIILGGSQKQYLQKLANLHSGWILGSYQTRYSKTHSYA
jgi:hypothetical protein